MLGSAGDNERENVVMNTHTKSRQLGQHSAEAGRSGWGGDA